MNVLATLSHRLNQAIASRNKFFFDSFLARVEHFETNLPEACAQLFKDLLPLLIFALGCIFLFWKPQHAPSSSSNTTAAPRKPAAEPRVVLRPGSRASVEHNREIHAAAERKPPAPSKLNTLGESAKKSIAESTSMMSAPAASLPEPLTTPIPRAALAQHTGADPSKPVYVAIKGTVFDVSGKREMYGPGGSYHVFAGKDGSKGLGMSSLKPEDAVPDYSGLDDKQMKTLDQWASFFTARYAVVGRVVD